MVRTRASSPPGGVKVATGSYTGDGNATQAIVGVGFRPRFLQIYLQIGGAIDNKGFKTDQDLTAAHWWRAGARSWMYSVDHIISLDADGFTVGDGTGFVNIFNINAQVYTYTAFS